MRVHDPRWIYVVLLRADLLRLYHILTKPLVNIPMVAVQSLALLAPTGGQFTAVHSPGRLPLLFLGFGDGRVIICLRSNDPDRMHTTVDCRLADMVSGLDNDGDLHRGTILAHGSQSLCRNGCRAQSTVP